MLSFVVYLWKIPKAFDNMSLLAYFLHNQSLGSVMKEGREVMIGSAELFEEDANEEAKDGGGAVGWT